MPTQIVSEEIKEDIFIEYPSKRLYLKALEILKNPCCPAHELMATQAAMYYEVAYN